MEETLTAHRLRVPDPDAELHQCDRVRLLDRRNRLPECKTLTAGDASPLLRLRDRKKIDTDRSKV
jgi:hypothetical protein